MRNYKLDTTLLPEVWITWLGSYGRIWMNNKGKRQNHPENWMNYEGEYSLNHRYSNNEKLPFGSTWATKNNDKLWVAAGSQLYYAYAKYHKDIDRLEIAAVRYDTTRGEGKHTWMYDGDRFFIGKDKSIIDQNGMHNHYSYNVKKRGTAYNAREMLSMIMRLTNGSKFLDEFKKFIGHNYFIIGNGTSVNIEYGWHIQKWYDSVQKVRSSGKTQKLVDELVKMPLGSIDGLECRYVPKPKISNIYRGDKYINNIIYFERVNDDWSVLRALIREDNGCFEEAWRVYIGEDGTNRIVAKSNNDWIPASQQRSWRYQGTYYFANEEEAEEKCNRIKYIMPIMSADDGIDVLITTLRFPFIEQLYKMGCEKMARAVARSSTPKSEIKSIFGDYYEEKEKSALRQIGMTKHQLYKYKDICELEGDRYYPWRGNVLKKMREMFGEDLSHIDNTTYDKYIEAFNTMTREFWGDRYVDNLNVDRSRFWKNLVRLADKNSNTYGIVSDTISTYWRLNVKPDIDWLFDDYSDIVRVHDALTELANEQDRQFRAYWNASEAERIRKDDEKRKKVDEERKCYEYEDENFIIRLPKDVQEIITEGSKQCICIGGYTNRHSNGETNLFFLRRKDDESTPFYAIEMNNDKRIVQIHGSCNKWLGNNPEAIPTVVRWLRKHDIKCDQNILTCTAKGYGRTNEYIEMPIVD